MAGVICVATTSTYFVLKLLMKNVFKSNSNFSQKEKFSNAFQYLKRRGLIEVKRKNHDIQIALTGAGRKRAEKYQIDDLEIQRPKKWDKKMESGNF